MSESKVSIPVPANFSFDECLKYLDRNYDDCMQVIVAPFLWKAVRFNEQILLLKTYEQEGLINTEIISGEASAAVCGFVKGFVEHLFDLERNISPFYNLLSMDPRMAYMCEAFSGLRLIGIADLFEALCWCIIGQQINLSFAYKVKRRLVEHYGEYVSYQGYQYYTFPTSEVLANASLHELRQMQFSERKAQYIIGVAQAFASGTISLAKLQLENNIDAKRSMLTSLKGVGTWTANYALMKCLKEITCIPKGDVGLLNALTEHGIIIDRKEELKIDNFFAGYTGWESYLVTYLWRSLAFKGKKAAEI